MKKVISTLLFTVVLGFFLRAAYIEKLPVTLIQPNGDKSVIKQENVESSYEYDEYGECKKWKYETTLKYYENETKVAPCHLHYHCYMTYFRSNVEIYNYKKKSNGHWKKYSINLTVDNTTFFFGNDCEYQFPLNEDVRQARASSLSNHCYSFNLVNVEILSAKNNSSVVGDYNWPGIPTTAVTDVLSW